MQKDNSVIEIRRKQYRLYIIILAMLCVVISAYTTIWEINYHSKYGFFQKTSATVIDHEIDGNAKFDIISYNVNNVEFQKTTSYESRNDVGDTITIYFDSTNPIGVIYHLDNTRIILPVVSGLLIFVLIGFSVLYVITFGHSTMQSSNKKQNKAKKKM